MANKTSIEWTDFNWNFLRGCSRVSEGCRNCYAEKIAARFSDKGLPYHGIAKRRDFVGDQRSSWTGEISFHEDILLKPLRWTKPRKVFVNSMSDLFHEKVKDEWLDRAFAVMALTPHITYQILTKRPHRMLEYLTAPSVRFPTSNEPRPEISYQLALLTDVTNRKSIDRSSAVQNRICHGGWPLPNVWLGVSVEDQKTADERIPLLLQSPAAVRWISAEPLLGPVDLEHRPTGFDIAWSNYLTGRDHIHDGREVVDQGVPIQYNKIDWIVVGGESGPKARPMHPEWVRSLRDQCLAVCKDCAALTAKYAVSTGPGFLDDSTHWASCQRPAFFFKQWGNWWPIGQMPDGVSDSYYDPKRGKPKRGSYDDRPAPKPVDTTVLQLDGSQEFAFPHGSMTCFNVGKHKSGRLLDGREWNEMPQIKEH